MFRTPLGVAILTLGVCVSSANAQDAAGLELSGSYRLLQPICPNVSCVSYPSGWQGSVSARVTIWLSVVGVVGGNFKTISTSTSAPIALGSGATGTLISRSDTSLAIYDFVGGPKATRQFARARVFGELLFGMTRLTYASSNSLSIPQENAQVGSAFSNISTAWEWQPHLGVDVIVAPRWAVRLGVGYRVLGAAHPNVKDGDVLLDTGIVFGLFGRSSRVSGSGQSN